MQTRGNEISLRNMKIWKPSWRRTMDYRGINPMLWAEVVNTETSKFQHLVPVKVLPFADYVDGRTIECDYKHGVDYGVAIGYAPTKGKNAGKPIRQISLVFADDDFDEKGSQNMEAFLTPMQATVSSLMENPKFAYAEFCPPAIDRRLDKKR